MAAIPVFNQKSYFLNTDKIHEITALGYGRKVASDKHRMLIESLVEELKAEKSGILLTAAPRSIPKNFVFIIEVTARVPKNQFFLYREDDQGGYAAYYVLTVPIKDLNNGFSDSEDDDSSMSEREEQLADKSMIHERGVVKIKKCVWARIEMKDLPGAWDACERWNYGSIKYTCEEFPEQFEFQVLTKKRGFVTEEEYEMREVKEKSKLSIIDAWESSSEDGVRGNGSEYGSNAKAAKCGVGEKGAGKEPRKARHVRGRKANTKGTKNAARKVANKGGK